MMNTQDPMNPQHEPSSGSTGQEGEQNPQPVTPPSEPQATPPQEPQAAPDYSFMQQNQELVGLQNKVQEARMEIAKYVVGQQEMVELLLTGILTNGHILLEGVPGIAKTLMAKVLSRTIGADFSRIQFTPDLMPSDVLGTSVFNMKTSEFNFKKGPIFSNIVLIDEINRSPAKTQAALFEVMEERQITVDGQRYELSFPFLVLATQNPVEQEGTYRLPEAQLDRFLFRVRIDYPSMADEAGILMRYRDTVKPPSLEGVSQVFSADDLAKMQGVVEKVRVEDQLVKYIAQIVCATREHGQIYLGGSPRASLALLRSSKALAAIRGRDFITPDDVKYMAKYVLNHRLVLTAEAEMEGRKVDDVITDIVDSTEVPR